MTQRRKSITKTTAPQDGPARFYCYRCGSAFSQAKGNFSTSRSPLYRGLGYLPVCHECMDALFDKYVKQLRDERAAMQRICMKFDLYWHDDIYNMAKKQENVKSLVRCYIGKTNMNRYMEKSYDDTIEEEAAALLAKRQARAVEIGFVDESDDEDIVEQHIPDVPLEVIDFWGPGFDADFYAELDRRYKKWTDGVDVSSHSVRSLYKQICVLEARINRSIAAGESIKDDMNLLNTVLGNLELKPSQKKEDTDSSLDKIPFGVGIKWCEDRRPIPDVDPAFKDQDGIIKYITTWFYGHLTKMAGRKDMYSKLYEDAIAKMRSEHLEYSDDDDEDLLADVLSEVGDVG